MRKTVTIDRRVYVLSPLRCKHMRQISDILSEQAHLSNSMFDELERWTPFILASIRIEHPAILPELLDEMTLDEFNNTWNAIISISGIKVVKSAEKNQSTDWGFLYSRICVCTGNSYREIDEMTLFEAEEVLDYLACHPTEAEILAAVYEVKTKGRSRRNTDENFDEKTFNELPSSVGGLEPVMGLPDELCANLKWAQELAAKYRKAVN